VLRHYPPEQFGPVAKPLHASRVQAGSARCPLVPGARLPNITSARDAPALSTAVPLPEIAVSADEDLPPTILARTAENPRCPIDHSRPCRQFLDRRGEASDTVGTVARPRGAHEGSEVKIRAFPFLAGARF
jgi:hypothetical protein